MVETSDRPHWQVGLPSSFIPLNEENPALSSRSQRLPSIMHTSQSTTSLFSLHKGLKRHNSFFGNDPSEDEDYHWPPITPIQSARRLSYYHERDEQDPRRSFLGPELLQTPQIRSMRLIGNANPRYKWHRYYKTREELKQMRKPLRKYYERNNFLVAQYIYIDRLLDSTLPHALLDEYDHVHEELSRIDEEQSPQECGTPNSHQNGDATPQKIKRTPKNLYTVPDETSPLLTGRERPDDASDLEELIDIEYDYEADADVDSSSPVVTTAIYVNLAANIILLAGKIAVMVMTSSLSVLASLVDAALDFLSTAVVWTTAWLISRQNQYEYPIGRRRLEPVGVLVFSVIMITAFFQVGLQSIQQLMSADHSIVQLGLPAVIIMLSTVVIKGGCWFWCRLVKNSSVQALAQDALTDVVFNIFSIIFPLVGYYAKIWWLDALGGLLLSAYVIINWSRTSSEHVRNLCGAAATSDERNVLLYLTMRFAKTIKYIQGLQAYHAGDQLNVEVDIVLDEDMNLRDSHDLSESLQYVLESVPIVDRAFVHSDYKRENLPSHMNQQA